jgi:tetraacyldisaccharide 4'-kinase
MNLSQRPLIERVMHTRGVRPTLLRIVLWFFSLFYSLAMTIRNRLYDAGIKRRHRLARPVISIGNITTGGTGKTPMVQWIARRLIEKGHRPAVLMRGYKTGRSGRSDEAMLLERSLNIPVIPNPDRVAGAELLLKEHPQTDVILLDDAFQHRRVERDLNIVLIDATQPLRGVLPAGMLREPLAGLKRADVLIITRSNEIKAEYLPDLEQRLRKYSPSAPILRSEHRLLTVTDGKRIEPMEFLAKRTIFSFCGIGNPTSFHEALLQTGAIDPGHRCYGDHHDYSKAEVDVITQRAREDGAEMLVTTEKDWVKIEPLLSEPNSIPIWRVQMEIAFNERDAQELLARIERVISRSTAKSPEEVSAAEPGG